MIFNVVYALGELACMYPVSGGFYTYSSRFIDPSWVSMKSERPAG